MNPTITVISAALLLIGLPIFCTLARKLFSRKPTDHAYAHGVLSIDGDAKHSAYYCDADIEVTVDGFDSYAEAQDTMWRIVNNSKCHKV